MSRFRTGGTILALLLDVVALRGPEATVHASAHATVDRQATAGTAAISGMVVDADTKRPIPGAVVLLTSEYHAAATNRVTDAKGRFVFADLAPGTYAVSAQKPGYLAGVYRGPQPDVLGSTLREDTISLGPGEWLGNIEVPLWRPGSIDGRVSDERGEPIVGRYVRVLRLAVIAGEKILGAVGTVPTDDRGIFSFAYLMSGTYVVAVLPVELSGLPQLADVATIYPLTYYPQARTISGAQTITIAPGRAARGIEIRVEPVEAHRVAGRIEGVAASEAERMHLGLVGVGEPQLGPSGLVASCWVQADGTFSFPSVPAGEYIVKAGPSIDSGVTATTPAGFPPDTLPTMRQASSGGSTFGIGQGLFLHTSHGNPYFVEDKLTVAGRDVTGVVLTVSAPPVVTGRLVVDEDGRNSGLTAPLVVGLDPDGAFASARPFAFVDRSDDSFVMPDVEPGRYFFRAGSSSGQIRRVSRAGNDVTDQPIAIHPGETADLLIVLTKPAQLHGRVSDGNMKTSATALVVYFPVDRTLWTSSGHDAPTFGACLAKTDGSYDCRATIPGSHAYYVVAVSDEWQERWRTIGFFERAARTAPVVNLEWGQSAARDLTLIDLPVQ